MWLLGLSRNSGLKGSIPTEIGLATSLDTLYVYEMEQWGGTIPSEIGLLTLMLDIDLTEANISGTLPPEIAALPSLTYLWISDNPRLSGTFPSTNQTQFESLRMNATMLTGEIPDSFCLFSELVFDCPDMCGCDCPCLDEDGATNTSDTES